MIRPMGTREGNPMQPLAWLVVGQTVWTVTV